jgi:iron-sulfur cluster assembly accessory protein
MNTENTIIEISKKAQEEILRIKAENPNPKIGLRLGVKGGGCSGLSYLIDFDEQKEKDIIIHQEGFDVFMDPKSSLYLQGSILEYQGGLSDRGFKFVNPNAENTCGCGESFSI